MISRVFNRMIKYEFKGDYILLEQKLKAFDEEFSPSSRQDVIDAAKNCIALDARMFDGHADLKSVIAAGECDTIIARGILHWWKFKTKQV